MNLLFRSPLLQFDITDPDAVKQHWPEILSGIKLSSQDLFSKIQRKQPDELSNKEKQAVYKYLLRGKYRPTPFGNWAGVGVGNWISTLSDQKEIDSFTTMTIPLPKPPYSNQTYWINPSILPWGDGWKFWDFDHKNEKWRYSRSENNLLIQRIRSLAHKGKPIDKEELFAPFSELLKNDKEEIWKSLIANQLLVGSPTTSYPESDLQINQFIHQRPAVPIRYKNKLEELFSEVGQLALPAESPYLKSFKEIFIAEFDDRFVTLNMLWKLVSRLDPSYTRSEELHSDQKPTQPVEKGQQAILDLQNPTYHYGNMDKVKHAQGLFRILDNGQLLLDNLVLNRPFVYGGRFTHRQEIFEYYKKQAIQDDGTLIADVLLIESRKANHISAHKNIATVQINCFSGSTDPNELDLSDTYIGILDGKFYLTAPKWGKFIIPVFQHPLNPQFITHPICRILWEIAHQDFLRPIYYSPGYFSSQDYTPQLNWGEIILQPRQWKLKWEESFIRENNLMEELLKKGIPKKVLIGHQDQELGLDLDSITDLSILQEEIRKHKTIQIQEWLWSSEKSPEADRRANLQFLWGMNLLRQKKELPKIQSLNYISEQESKEWVSVRILLIADFQQTVVLQQINSLAEVLAQQGNLLFFYLFYKIKHPEIRLRVRIHKPQERTVILSGIYSIFAKIPDVDHIKIHPYYPEKSKYSEEGMHISEQLFYCESKLLLELNPKSEVDKLSLAAGLGSIFLENTDQLEYWIAHFRKLSDPKVGHYSAKAYLSTFNELTTREWRSYYSSLIRRHPWFRNSEKRRNWIGNHIHMLVNRVFWDSGLEMESEVNALLCSIMREKKYGREKVN